MNGEASFVTDPVSVTPAADPHAARLMYEVAKLVDNQPGKMVAIVRGEIDPESNVLSVTWDWFWRPLP